MPQSGDAICHRWLNIEATLLFAAALSPVPKTVGEEASFTQEALTMI